MEGFRTSEGFRTTEGCRTRRSTMLRHAIGYLDRPCNDLRPCSQHDSRHTQLWRLSIYDWLKTNWQRRLVPVHQLIELFEMGLHMKDGPAADQDFEWPLLEELARLLMPHARAGGCPVARLVLRIAWKRLGRHFATRQSAPAAAAAAPAAPAATSAAKCSLSHLALPRPCLRQGVQI